MAYLAPRRQHDAARLVAEQGRGDARGVQLVELGMTDAARDQLDQYLRGSGIGKLDLLGQSDDGVNTTIVAATDDGSSATIVVEFDTSIGYGSVERD